ncbi:MAG: DUF86 domain-containing protein [Halobacteriales archaeon]
MICSLRYPTTTTNSSYRLPCYEEFVEDKKTVDAVLRNFEVIGEAAKNVPEETRREYSHVPWAEMAGMRDKLIHGYATIELRPTLPASTGVR